MTELAIYKKLIQNLKAGLHSNRFCRLLSVFVRLLHQKVFSFSTAFLHAHIRINQTVTY